MRNVPISFLAAARRKPTGLNVCRNDCAGMHRGGPYWLPPRRAPFGRRAGQPSEGAPTGTARSPRARQRSRSPFTAAGRRVARFVGLGQNQNARVLRSIPLQGTCAMARPRGTKLWIVAAEACGAFFGPMGTDHCEWYACPRLTLFATEWSAARRKPVRAAAMHFGAANSADEQARRLPPSGRRKFPSGNFRSARDFEGAKRVSRGQAQRQPETSPLARRPPHTPPPPQPLEVRPRLLGIEECPHYS